MSPNHNGPEPHIQTILIIGCGLIGTSLAMAWHEAFPHLQMFGVEPNPNHRACAMNTRAFVDIYPSPPSHRFDLAVLAIPSVEAVAFLSRQTEVATWWMDVCSVKTPITAAADRCGLRLRFAPTHPMAGLAEGGPTHATSRLFHGQTWIALDDWPAYRTVESFIVSTGAHLTTVPSAGVHDDIVAATSHLIHLVSVTATQTVVALQGNPFRWAPFTGPGFRDTTRLSASPSGFWPSTLLENRESVITAIDAYTAQLSIIREALEQGDSTKLEQILDSSSVTRRLWEEARS